MKGNDGHSRITHRLNGVVSDGVPVKPIPRDHGVDQRVVNPGPQGVTDFFVAKAGLDQVVETRGGVRIWPLNRLDDPPHAGLGPVAIGVLHQRDDFFVSVGAGQRLGIG